MQTVFDRDRDPDLFILKMRVRRILEQRCGRTFIDHIERYLTACNAIAHQIEQIEQTVIPADHS